MGRTWEKLPNLLSKKKNTKIRNRNRKAKFSIKLLGSHWVGENVSEDTLHNWSRPDMRLTTENKSKKNAAVCCLSHDVWKMVQRMSNCFDCFHLSVDLFVPNFSFIVFAMSSHAFRASLLLSRSKFSAQSYPSSVYPSFLNRRRRWAWSVEFDQFWRRRCRGILRRIRLGLSCCPSRTINCAVGIWILGIFRVTTEKNGELRRVVIVKSTSVHGKEKARTETNLARLMFCSIAIDW